MNWASSPRRTVSSSGDSFISAPTSKIPKRDGKHRNTENLWLWSQRHITGNRETASLILSKGNIICLPLLPLPHFPRSLSNSLYLICLIHTTSTFNSKSRFGFWVMCWTISYLPVDKQPAYSLYFLKKLQTIPLTPYNTKNITICTIPLLTLSESSL